MLIKIINKTEYKRHYQVYHSKILIIPIPNTHKRIDLGFKIKNRERKIKNKKQVHLCSHQVVMDGRKKSISVEPTANGDSITDGKHADLDSGIGSESLVELKNEVPVVPDVLPQWSIRRSNHGAVPQSVVVADNSSYFHQLDQSLVVVQIVVFVCIHEDEVE